MPPPRFHPFVRLAICGLGLLAIAAIVGGVIFLGSQLATNLTGRAPNEPLEQLALRYALPITLLTYPASLLWIALCRVQFDKRSFASLGLHRRRALPDSLRGALAGFLTIGLLWAILWITGAITVGGWSPQAVEDGGNALLPLFGYALMFIAVGCFEEILFRGYILHNLCAWMGWPLALGLQAVLFAVVHLGNGDGNAEILRAALSGLPNIAIIAVFFALAYRKTGSLWFPIGFHAAWNWGLGCVFSMPVSGIDTYKLLDVQAAPISWLSGGKFGAEGSLLLFPIVGTLIYFLSKQPDHPQAVYDLSLLTDSPPELPTVPILPGEPVPTAEETPSENRFRTRFGSATGFDAETLRELRDIQKQREAEAPKPLPIREPEPVIEVAPPPPEVPPIFEPPVVEPVVVQPTEVVRTEAPQPETPPQRVEEVAPPVETTPAPPTPAAPPTEKKKPSPRW